MQHQLISHGFPYPHEVGADADGAWLQHIMATGQTPPPSAAWGRREEQYAAWGRGQHDAATAGQQLWLPLPSGVWDCPNTTHGSLNTSWEKGRQLAAARKKEEESGGPAKEGNVCLSLLCCSQQVQSFQGSPWRSVRVH